MKTLFSILSAVLLCLTAAAQTKKVTSADSKFAVLTFDEQIDKVAVGKQTAYLLTYRYGDNAVIAIDRATGKISTPIVGIKTAPRAKIQDIAVLPDDRLVLFSQNEGVRVFDGKSLETSPLVWRPDAKGMVEAYLSIGPAGHILINSKDKNQVLLNPQFKQIAQFSTTGARSWGVVDKEATIWLADMSNLIKLDSLGNKLAQFKTYADPFKEIDELLGLSLAPDSKVYVATKRKVFGTPSNGTKLEPAVAIADNDQNNTFRKFYVSPQGEFFSTSDDYQNRGIFEYGTDLSAAPKGGVKIVTDIVEKSAAGSTSRPIEFEPAQSNFVADDQGNLLVYSTYPARMFLYNPKGIKGYSDLKGKFTPVK